MTKKNRIFRNRTKKHNKGGTAKRSLNEDFSQDNRPNKRPPPILQPAVNKIKLEKLLLTPNNDVINRIYKITEMIENKDYDVTYTYDLNEEGLPISFDGNNLLHQAILNEYYPQAILLIEQNQTNEEFLNKQNSSGYTPFMISIKEGNLNVFNKFLDIQKNNIAKIDVGVNKKITYPYIDEAGITKFTTLLYCLHKLIKYTYEDDDDDDTSSIDNTIQNYPSFNVYKKMSSELINTFGNKLDVNYTLANGLTALIYITDVFITFSDYPEYIKIINAILDTNDYNPNSVYKEETTFGEKETTAFINCSATGVYDLVLKMLNKRTLPNFDFDINHKTSTAVNALYISFLNIDIHGDGFKVPNLLMDNGIDINIIEEVNGVKGKSLLIHMINNSLYNILISASVVNSEEEKQLFIHSFEEFVKIVNRVIEKGPEESNVKYIQHLSNNSLGNKNTALLTYLIQLSIFKAHYTILNNNSVLNIFSKELLERIPIAILNSTTFSLDYFDVKTSYTTPGINNETVLDLSIRLGLNNVTQKIEEAILGLEEQEEKVNIKQSINIFDKGTNLNGEEFSLYEHIQKTTNNIVFKLNENMYLLTKKDIRKHADKDENIVYGCNVRDEFSLDNVEKNISYSLLYKYSPIQGVINYDDVMELINAPYVGQLFVLEQTGTINSNVNKRWIDFQTGRNPNWDPSYDRQVFCRAGPLAIYKLKLVVPSIPINNLNKEDDTTIVSHVEPVVDGVLKVKARITFKTPENRLVDKGIKDFEIVKDKTTIKDIKTRIINSILDVNEPNSNMDMEVRRIILNGRDYTNSDNTNVSDIIKIGEINVFQPVIVAVKNNITGGKKRQNGKKRYSLKNR